MVILKVEATISIVRLGGNLRNGSLVLDVVFRLVPVKVLSQHVLVKLYFDKKIIKSFTLRVPHHFATREMQIQPVISMERVRSGIHTIKMALSRAYPRSDDVAQKETKINYDAKIEMLLSEDSPRVVSTGRLSRIDVVEEDAKKLFERMEERRRREIILRRQQ